MTEAADHSQDPPVTYRESERILTNDYTAAAAGAHVPGGSHGDFRATTALNGGEQIGVVIGEVSGCTPQTRLEANAIRDQLTSQLADGRSPAEALEAVNEQLTARESTDSLATAFVGKIEPATGQITYASAGHEPALLAASAEDLAAPNVVDTLETGNIPLGIAPATYEEGNAVLNEGGTLLLYTNGVTDARQTTPTLEPLGTTRLRGLLHRFAALPTAQLVGALVRTVMNFCGSRIRDDLTLLAIRRRARAAAAGHGDAA